MRHLTDDNAEIIIENVLYKEKIRNIVYNITGILLLTSGTISIAIIGKFLTKKSSINNEITQANIHIYSFSEILNKYIKSIQINGLKNIPKIALLEIISDNEENVGKNSIHTIYKKLQETNAFEEIAVRRILPNIISIHLKERHFIARVKYTTLTNEYLIDINGNIANRYSTFINFYQDLPVVHNLTNKEIFLDLYHLLDENFIKTYIKEFDVIGNRRVNVILKNKTLIKFPRENTKEAIESMNYLIKNFPILTDDTEIEYIDLRIPNKIYVGYKN